MGNSGAGQPVARRQVRARCRRMSMVAQETGLGRESLYKSLSAEGNPEFATVLKVVSALGLRLQATTAPGAGGE